MVPRTFAASASAKSEIALTRSSPMSRRSPPTRTRNCLGLVDACLTVDLGEHPEVAAVPRNLIDRRAGLQAGGVLVLRRLGRLGPTVKLALHDADLRATEAGRDSGGL